MHRIATALTATVALSLGLLGCAGFNPKPLEEIPFLERARTRERDKVRVTVAVLSPEETEAAFGADFSDDAIQPVWVKVENRSDGPLWFFPTRLDADYYSPAEVAYKNRFTFSKSKNNRMRAHFAKLAFQSPVGPGQTTAGFVLTKMDPGLKFVKVTLGGLEGLKSYHFVLDVPGIKADYQDVDLEALSAKSTIVDCDEKQLRAALEALPDCTTNRWGTGKGDPLNFVFIGSVEDMVTALVGSGWDVTERMSAGSVWRTITSFLYGRRDRHMPVSALYAFGRRQDAAFQKARQTVSERNHLRLWWTPLRFKGNDVWLGQISRDIGVKFTLRTGFLFTHVVDPNVDNDRSFLIENLIDAEALTRLGYVSGVGAASAEEPRHNLGGDPYYTDGLRAVMMCTKRPVPFSEITFFDWEVPPHAEPYRDGILKREERAKQQEKR